MDVKKLKDSLAVVIESAKSLKAAFPSITEAQALEVVVGLLNDK